MAKLDDIRGCKIRVSKNSESAMVQEAAFEFGFTNKLGNKVPDVKHAPFIFFCKDKKFDYALDGFFFSDSSLNEIFFYDGAFHDCEKQVDAVLEISASKVIDESKVKEVIAKINAGCINKEESPIDTGNAIHAALDHQPGDIVFNKNGFKYKQFLCLHPLDLNVSLCQCGNGDILEVLNSELLSYSDNLAIIKAEVDNAKKLHEEYVSCVYKNNKMAIAIPFDDMDIEGIKIWIEFAKRVTINEK